MKKSVLAVILCATSFGALAFDDFEGKYVKVADTLTSFDAIIKGEADDLPEQAFLYVGDLAEARAKAAAMAK
jgi:F-type H+-transporting ATPase subunit beta